MRIDLLEILGQHGQISFKEFLEKLELYIHLENMKAYHRGVADSQRVQLEAKEML